jgi:chemotaxis protein MotB
MGRKKKPEEHVNHERWMVSYADFITLLVCLFRDDVLHLHRQHR